MAPTLRDASYGMEEALRQVMEYIINRKQHLSHYWVLIHAKTYDSDHIFSKVVILPQCPPKMLGTICYEINNLSGTQRQLWVLPADFDIPLEYLSEDKQVPQNVLDSAKTVIPIING